MYLSLYPAPPHRDYHRQRHLLDTATFHANKLERLVGVSKLLDLRWVEHNDDEVLVRWSPLAYPPKLEHLGIVTFPTLGHQYEENNHWRLFISKVSIRTVFRYMSY